MKISARLFVLFFMAPVAGLCNLGQNELQISQVYGTPTDKGQISKSLKAMRYSINDLHITVTYLFGTSQCEEYRRADGAPLTEEQIQSILESNANNLSWVAGASASAAAREWIIPGPAPAADSSGSAKQAVVLAVSPQHVSAGGNKMAAVGIMNPNADTVSAPAAPAVLRRALYLPADSNACLAVSTAAYESVARRELPGNRPRLPPANAPAPATPPGRSRNNACIAGPGGVINPCGAWINRPPGILIQ